MKNLFEKDQRIIYYDDASGVSISGEILYVDKTNKEYTNKFDKVDGPSEMDFDIVHLACKIDRKYQLDLI